MATGTAATAHGLARWIGDYGAFSLGGLSLAVSALSFRRSGRALRLGGADARVTLTQAPLGEGVMFFMRVVNRGRAATTVEKFWIQGKGGSRVEAVSGGGMHALSMQDLDWGGPRLGGELPPQSTLSYTLGPSGTYWAMAADNTSGITAETLTRPVRAEVLLGNGSRVRSSWVTYDWASDPPPAEP